MYNLTEHINRSTVSAVPMRKMALEGGCSYGEDGLLGGLYLWGRWPWRGAVPIRKMAFEGDCTYEEDGLWGGLSVGLLHELGLEGDHADEAVNRHERGADDEVVHRVAEQPAQWGQKVCTTNSVSQGGFGTGYISCRHTHTHMFLFTSFKCVLIP